MMPSRGMGAMSSSKIPRAKRRGDSKPVLGTDEPIKTYAKGGKSKVNAAGNYTKPGMRESLFKSIKARAVQGTGAGQWSARKAQLLAKQYKAKGGGYRG
ncbi:hypothetical protein EBT31_20235 [bacterium]|nr:hypothetical protein [bacterium]